MTDVEGGESRPLVGSDANGRASRRSSEGFKLNSKLAYIILLTVVVIGAMSLLLFRRGGGGGGGGGENDLEDHDQAFPSPLNPPAEPAERAVMYRPFCLT